MMDIKIDTKSITLGILKNSIMSPLLFNFYMHPLDEFIEKKIESVVKIDKRKLNSEYKKMARSDSSKIEKLLAKTKYKIIKEQKKLTKRFEIRKLINDFRKIPVRMYYARYANDFILGFFMPKIQTKPIIEDIIKFITDTLKFKITQTILRDTISDKTPFLGFKIQMISFKKFNYSKNKELEAYKRHKNMIFKKGAQEYKKFLKMIEWLGRKAVANVVSKKISPEKYIVKEKELRKIIPETVQQEN